MRSHRVCFAVVVTAIAAVGCPDLDLASEVPGAVIACTANADCPAGLVCGIDSGLCLPADGVDDTDAPLASDVVLDPAAFAPGTPVTLTFSVDEPLAREPVLVLTPDVITATLTSGDHRQDDRRFTFAFTVPAGADAPASIGASLTLVDLVNNRRTQVLQPLAVDVVGPALNDITPTIAGSTKSHATNGDDLAVAVTLADGDTLESGTVRQGTTVVGSLAIVDNSFQPLRLQDLSDGVDLVVDVVARDVFGNEASGTSGGLPTDTRAPAFARSDILVDDSVSRSIVAAATVDFALEGAVDVIDFCVRDAGVGCEEDGDFSAAGLVVSHGLGLERGGVLVEVVGRDRAHNQTVVPVPLVLLPDGDLGVEADVLPPEGQTTVKTTDALQIRGTTFPGAEVAITLIDANSGDPVVIRPRDVLADADGAFETIETVPAGVRNGASLGASIVVTVRVADADIALPAFTTTTVLDVDLVPPSVVLRTPSTTVGGDVVNIDYDIDGASSATVGGDIDAADAVAGLSPTQVVSGVIGVDLNDGDGTRTVTVEVRDEAGNTAQAAVAFTVDSTIPTVELLMRNIDRAVDGVRPASRIVFSGTTSDNRIVTEELFFVDNGGTEIAACTRRLSLVLTPVGDSFSVGIAVPVTVGPCPGAARVGARLVVENDAGQDSQAILSVARLDIDDDGSVDGADFYFDDAPPVPEPVLVTIDRSQPPARDAIVEVRGAQSLLVAPVRDIDIVVQASDDHALRATITGVSPVTASSFDVDPGTASAAQPFTIEGGDGDKTIALTIEDEVGNVAGPINTTVVLDTLAPTLPQVTSTVYREVHAAADLGAEDDLSAFLLSGEANAVEGNARIFAFGPGDDARTDIVTVDVSTAAGNGSFAPIDVSDLGAPVVDLAVVAVDRAGNRSPALTITRPRFALTPSVDVIGTAPAIVGVTIIGALQGSPRGEVRSAAGPVSTDVGDITIAGAGPGAFTVTVGPDVDDGLVEGNASAVAVISGAGPNLHPSSVSEDGVALAVDFSAPTVVAAQVRVSEVAGQNDTLLGLAAAAVDSAGADAPSLAGRQVRITGGSVNVVTAINADGSFGPVSLGADAPDAITVVVVDDVARNPGVPLLLQAPAISAPVLSRSRIRAGDVVTGTFTVTDDNGLGTDPTISLGAQVVRVDSAVAVGAVTSVSFSFTASATEDSGPKTLTINALDTIGHASTRSVGGAVTLDVDAPVVVVDQPTAVVTNDPVIRATVSDSPGGAGAATVTRISLREQGGPFFDGAGFNAVTEVLLADEDGGGGFARNFSAALRDGISYIARLEAVDDVGNTTSVALSFAFDTSAPVLVFTTPPVSGGRSVEVPYVATIDDPAATLLCSIDSSSEIPCATTGPVRVPFGTTTVVFTAVDDAGNRSAPEPFVVTVSPRRQLAGGDGTVCAVGVDDGSLRCWGDNRDGHLGDPSIPGGGAPFGFITPTPVWSGITWRQIAVGGNALCGIDSVGEVLCWGEVFDGLVPTSFLPQNLAVIGEPRTISELSGSTHIAMNATRGCAAVPRVGGGADVRCWGTPLRNRAPGERFENFPTFGTVAGLDVGDDHVCVADISGTVSCVGTNSLGQLGRTAQLDQPTDFMAPVGVAGTDLDVGPARTCARFGVELRCVGDNGDGAIRLAEGFDLRGEFGIFGFPALLRLDATSSSSVVGDLPEAIGFSTAGNRTCAVGRDGRIRCLGSGALGARGDGETNTGRAVGLFGTDTFDDVLALEGTTCGLRSSDGAVLCAGDNGHGEVDPSGSSTTFVEVPLSGSFVDAIDATDRSLCVLTDAGRSCTGDSSGNSWMLGGESCFATFQCGVGSVCDGSQCRVAAAVPTADTPVLVAGSSGSRTRFAMGDDVRCLAGVGGVDCTGIPGRHLGRGVEANTRFDDDPARLPTMAPVVVTAGPGRDDPLDIDTTVIAVGDRTACAAGRDTTNSDEVIACWGDEGIQGSSDVAVRTRLPQGFTVQAMRLGAEHGCFMQGGNQIQCFGNSALGARGDNGVGGDISVVVDRNNGNQPFVGRLGFQQASFDAAGSTTCAVPFSGNGVACWGDNRRRLVELGPNPGPSFNAAVVRSDGALDQSFQAVGMTEDVACAVGGSGVVCWGKAMVPLGVGSPPGRLDPVALPFPPGVSLERFVVGDGFICGAGSGGASTSLFCLGAGTAGIFGNGNGVIETPTVVLP